MRNLPRCQQGITRTEAKTVRSHLELELAFENRKPFLLLVMQVTSRATLRKVGVLQDERITLVRQTHFEGDGANTEPAALAFAIGTSGNSQCRRLIR